MANFLAGFEIEMVPTLDSSVVGRTHSIYYNRGHVCGYEFTPQKYQLFP